MEPNGRPERDDKIPPGAYLRVTLFIFVLVVVVGFAGYACDRLG